MKLHIQVPIAVKVTVTLFTNVTVHAGELIGCA